MATPDGEVLPASTKPSSVRSDGARVADPLLAHRRAFGGEDCGSARCSVTEDKRAGVAKPGHQLLAVPTSRGSTLGNRGATLASGDGHHHQGEESGSQSFRGEQLHRSWEPWQRKISDESGKGPRERKGQDQGEDKGGEKGRGCEEELIGGEAERGEAPGVTRAPVGPQKVAITMRGFFPRYSGPMADKNILFIEDVQGGAGVNYNPATCTPRPSSFSDTLAPSASGEKEAPLGVRLGLLGSLIKERFLEVALHSQYTGMGTVSKIVPLPTSGNQISRFFVSALPHEVVKRQFASQRTFVPQFFVTCSFLQSFCKSYSNGLSIIKQAFFHIFSLFRFSRTFTAKWSI